MFMKKLEKITPLVIVLLVLTMFAACISDDADDDKDSRQKTIVHCVFNVDNESSTRAITSSNENTISDITVLIFDKDGDCIGHQYATSTTSMDIVTRIAEECSVYAIANIGDASYFAGVNTIEKLNEMYTTISSADKLETNGSTTGSQGSLMIGSSKGVNISKNMTLPTITLYHQCAKITINITPASGVTIKDLQLFNVPLSSYITDTHTAVTESPDGNYGSFSLLQCNSTSKVTKTYYVYENLAGTNVNCTTEKMRYKDYAPAHSSFLVVHAKKSSSWQSSYYIYMGGINDNDLTVDYTNFNIKRNRNYIVNVSLGVNGGSGDARVTYSSTVGSFTTIQGTASVGDLFYDDGTTIKSATNSPIGVVFSNLLSESDFNAGYTHGYVIALKNVSSTVCYWGTSGTNPTGHYYGNVTLAEERSDKNGLIYTTAIRDFTGSTPDTYPAAWAAYAYRGSALIPEVITNTSGWYLPSFGQVYDLCMYLGGLDGKTRYDGQAWVYWRDYGAWCASTLNTKLTNLGLTAGTDYDAFVSQNGIGYWTSSESSTVKAYRLAFYSDDNRVDIGDHGNENKWNTTSSYGYALQYYVRPVLAY